MSVTYEQLQNWKTTTGFAGFLLDPDALTPETEPYAVNTVSGLRHPGLLDDIRLLAKNAGLAATPLIFIDTGLETNAQAMKIYGQNIIVINSHVLERNDPRALRGVIAHELAHLVYGHLEARAVIPYGYFAQKKRLQRIRHQETVADELGIVIAGDAAGLISILGHYVPRKKATLAGRAVDGIKRRLKTHSKEHPRTEKRIKHLRKLAITCAAEIEAGKLNLDVLRDKLAGDFAQAAAPKLSVPAVTAVDIVKRSGVLCARV